MLGKILVIVVAMLVSNITFAKGSDSNYLSVSQGISAPSKNTAINFSNGFTRQNPVAASYYDSAQVAIQYVTTDNEDDTSTTSAGAELGLGNGTMGVGLGYIKSDCDDCEGSSGAIVGYKASSFAIGIGYHEERNYTLGLLFNPDQGHRLGITANLNDVEDSTDDIKSYGVGYSYVSSGFIVSVDATKRDDPSSEETNDIIKVSPGVLINAQSISVSLTLDNYMNDEDEVYENNTWFGLGFEFSSGNFSLYHDYVGDWAAVVALTF